MKTISINGVRYAYEVTKPKAKDKAGNIEISILENTEVEEKTFEDEIVIQSKKVNKGTAKKPKWVIERREVPQKIEVINFKKGIKTIPHSDIALQTNLPAFLIRKIVINHILQNPNPKK